MMQPRGVEATNCSGTDEDDVNRPAAMFRTLSAYTTRYQVFTVEPEVGELTWMGLFVQAVM